LILQLLYHSASRFASLEEAYKVGQKPVGADMIENVLAKDINRLKPRLTELQSELLAAGIPL
jgi:hypothetical protein